VSGASVFCGADSLVHHLGRIAVQREDGSWLLDGMLPMDDFKEIFAVELPREGRADYQTPAGFLMSCQGRIPSTADHFEWGLRFEVVGMDGKRVDKVLVHARPEERT
jgi:putative hemolysin